MFTNRKQAGQLLAKRLLPELCKDSRFGPLQTVVVGLPRGGVPVARELCQAIDCPLDILVSKKIGALGQPELAIGAVSSDGVVVIDEQLSAYLKTVAGYIDSETRRLTGTTRDLEKHWSEAAGLKPRVDLKGKRVVVADDGVATGMTAVAAARSLRRRGAAEIILAAPVMSFEAYRMLKKEYDQVVTLGTPSDFGAVGQYYQDFHQVEESEVTEALRQARESFLSGANKSDVPA